MRTSRWKWLVPIVGLLSLALAPQAGAQEALLPNASGWILAHIDTETTGLIPGYHELVDIGIVYTDFDGNILQEWHKRLMPLHPERADPGAVKINGFDPKVWRKEGALSPSRALEQMLAFEDDHFPGKTILRVAYNCKFDAAFFDHLFRDNGKDADKPHYSYFWLDIPSMAWMMGYRFLSEADLAKALGVKDSPRASKGDSPLEHTGLADAETNVRVYRALLALRQQQTRQSPSGR